MSKEGNETKDNQSEKIVGTCQCGKPLYPVYNSIGKRIGVNHTSDDEDYHNNFFSNMFDKPELN